MDEFEELLASKHESPLGPDCLPKSMYRSAGGVVQFLCAYQAILQGAALPAGFDTSRTVFIPNLLKLISKVSLPVRLNLRPLTLCDCDRRVRTAAMSSGLRRYSIECIHPSQRCLTWRIMTEHYLRLRPLQSHQGPATLKNVGSFSLTSRAPTLTWTTEGSSWFWSGAGVPYHSTRNKFERFRGVLELISRFEFDLCRCGIFF